MEETLIMYRKISAVRKKRVNGVAPVAGHYVLIPKDMIVLMELSDGSPLKVVCSKEKMVIAKVEK